MAEKCTPAQPPSAVGNPLQPSEMKPVPPVLVLPFDKKPVRRNPGVLIAWIHSHSANPYPTKGEKYVLSWHTGMSLRQLNDWFANARRSIKKGGYLKWREKHSAALLGIDCRI